MKIIVWILKKAEILSAISIRLVYLTGKSKVPIHPKHLIKKDDSFLKRFLEKNMTVLDVGCGSGQYTLKVSPFVKKVISLDKDQKNLEIARKRSALAEFSNILFLKGNVEKKIEIKTSSIDLVILIDILEHIKKRQKFLKEIKRVAKKGAKVLVIIPNNETSWKILQRKYGISSFSDPDHKIEYTKSSISEELIKAGFQVEKITPHSYDTPFAPFIDLVGGISLNYYGKLHNWKQKMLKSNPSDCSGFIVIATK